MHTEEPVIRHPAKQHVEEEVLPIKEIVKTPEEAKKKAVKKENTKDAQAMELVKKYHTFGRNTPAFLLTEVKLAEDNQ